VFGLKFFRAPLLGICPIDRRFGPAAGCLVATILAAALPFTHAQASSSILVDIDSGKVLKADKATYPWYPASTTKLMTLYVILNAIKDNRVTPDTLFTVSRNANAQSPTKMGYPIGTQVTVDNALKMMMVKSANDMAVLLAEGLDGTVESFASEMTNTAIRIGMTQSNFVNPNGLPADGHVTSARDLAILARALYRDFPQNDFYWHIPAIKYGKRIVRNYNPLLGRYPGTDGMKTGFICASGFNLVATAKRDGKRLIAVVLGAPSGAARAMKAADMLESGFSQNPLAWLTPALGPVDALQPISTDPPNLTDQMCGPHRKRNHSEDEDIDADAGGANNSSGDSNSQTSFMLSALRGPTPKNTNLLTDIGPITPIVVYTGPTRTQAELASLPPDPAVDPVKKKGKGKGKGAAAKGGKTPAKGPDGKASSGKSSSASPPSSSPPSGGSSGSSPWTPMSSSALAGSPPPELKTTTSATDALAAKKPKPKPPAQPTAAAN
jgi:D-alanyl-D-alanine carboxypeptidase